MGGGKWEEGSGRREGKRVKVGGRQGKEGKEGQGEEGREGRRGKGKGEEETGRRRKNF